MTQISLTQFETRHRQIEAQLEREHALATGRRVVERPRRTPALVQGRPGRRRGLAGRRLRAAVRRRAR